MTLDTNAPAFTKRYIDLAQPRLGTKATFVTDDFFAEVSRMLNPEPAVFIDGKYDENGKWMDGWESRRKRGEGYDYAIVKLGLAGVIKGFDIDTSHFTGNYAPACSIDACISDADVPAEAAKWVEILPATNLSGDTHHYLEIADDAAYTHLRLNIYPDGGVARLRVYGVPQVDWSAKETGGLVDLAATVNGGRAIACNDAHFGVPDNLLAPGRGVNMGDGWETRRRREPGHDWCIIALGAPGEIEKIEIDTAHFKGNFPDECSIQAAFVDWGTEDALTSQSIYWKTLLPKQKMSMDAIHEYSDQVQKIGKVNYVRLNIHPDGGVSRLRLFGKPAK
ncbi:allantoicase [Aestuariispira insulae]|nr:allantoicase [Aestuariispira insulae]